MCLEYYAFFVALLFCGILATLLFFVVNSLGLKKIDGEKISAYECGFHPFEDTRQKFNVRFYLVSIIFIIFDLEVVYLFPWIMCFRDSGIMGYSLMFIFLSLLTFGFVYEWIKGALTWE